MATHLRRPFDSVTCPKEGPVLHHTIREFPDILLDGDVAFTMTLTGVVNGSDVLVEGVGQTREADGLLWGEYLLRRFPEGMDPRILNAFVITGHNATSQNVQGAENPFRPLTHEYTRTVEFTDGNELVLHARCDRHDNRIVSDFRLDGSVGDHALVRAEPLVEAWVPLGPGHIGGHFRIAWVTRDGSRLVGDAKTDYHLSANGELGETLHRFVTIQSRVEGPRFGQTQQVTLFRTLPGHGTMQQQGFE